MRTLQILTVASGIVLAISGPSLAASRTQATSGYNDVNTVRTYGDLDPSNPPYARNSGFNAYGSADLERTFRNAPSRVSVCPVAETAVSRSPVRRSGQLVMAETKTPAAMRGFTA